MGKDRISQQTEATLDQVPSQEFYPSDLTEEGKVAIEKLKANPQGYIPFSFWGLPQGDYSVPMMGVNVDGEMVNLDRRTGLGKEIYDRFALSHSA